MSEQLGRLQTLPEEKYPWHVRLIFATQRRRFGNVLNPMYFWGRSGPLAWMMTLFFVAIDRKKNPITKELRALLSVRVSQMNSCSFCVDIHSLFLLESGAQRNKLEMLGKWRESDCFSAKEKAALNYAESMTGQGAEVSDTVFSELHKNFSEAEIIELTGLIAYQNLSSRFNNALKIKPQGFCKL